MAWNHQFHCHGRFSEPTSTWALSKNRFTRKSACVIICLWNPMNMPSSTIDLLLFLRGILQFRHLKKKKKEPHLGPPWSFSHPEISISTKNRTIWGASESEVWPWRVLPPTLAAGTAEGAQRTASRTATGCNGEGHFFEIEDFYRFSSKRSALKRTVCRFVWFWGVPNLDGYFKEILKPWLNSTKIGSVRSISGNGGQCVLVLPDSKLNVEKHFANITVRIPTCVQFWTI